MTKADWEYEDPVMQQRSDFSKFRHDVNMLHSMIESFHTELAKLTPINEQLCGYVRRIAGAAPQTASQETLTRILANSDSQTGVAQAFEQTKPDHRALLDQLERLRAEMSHLETRMKERHIAAERKDHYLAKVEKLKKKNAESERYHRNTQKLAHAETAFEDIDKFVTTKLKEFMDSRFETIDSIVQKHREGVRKYFKIACTEPVLGDINKGDKSNSGALRQAAPLSPVSMIMSPSSSAMVLEPPTPYSAAKDLATPVAVTIPAAVEEEGAKSSKKASPKSSKSKLGMSPATAQVEAPVESPAHAAVEQQELAPVTPEGITGSAVE